MFSGLAAECGEITAIRQGDETAVKQTLRCRYHNGLNRVVDLYSLQISRKIIEHRYIQPGKSFYCISRLDSVYIFLFLEKGLNKSFRYTFRLCLREN